MIHTSPDLYNNLQTALQLSLLVMFLVFSRVPTANTIVLPSGHPVLLNHETVLLPVPLQVRTDDLMVSVITYNRMCLLQYILMT
jgi:hypothetical protein